MPTTIGMQLHKPHGTREFVYIAVCSIYWNWVYIFACLKPGLHFERKSTAYTQTMPIYAVGIAQVPSVNTPTIRRLLRVDAGLSLANSPQPLRIRRL